MAFSATANAATISYSHTTAAADAPFTDSFTLPNFDPLLGTLEQVVISATSNETAEVDVYNANAAARSFTNATAAILLTVTAPAGLTLTVTATAGPISGIAAPGLNAFAGETGTATNSITIPISDFASFIGGGTLSSYSVAFDSGTYAGSAGRLVFFGGSSIDSGVTTVTYTYADPVFASGASGQADLPEPGVLALFGVAVAGLMVVRRAPFQVSWPHPDDYPLDFSHGAGLTGCPSRRSSR